jgi:putative MATE family efflux protein
MPKLVKEGVFRTLAKMAVPMLAGTFAMTMYNLTNAWFVAMLGTEALAAISFTFPVVMLLMFLTRGLSSGAMTLVASALGADKKRKAAALTTYTLALTVCFALVMSVAGLLTIRPLFSLLGASGETLNLTERYMEIWYAGAAVMALHIVVSDLIISSGNTRVVSLLMVGSTVLNILLDMALILGMFGMPRLGIVGAALATLITQAAALAAACYILFVRMRLLEIRRMRTATLLTAWRKILTFSIPGSLGMILTPVSAAIITRLVADYGDEAVAALGVAGRIEMFAFMIPMTVGISLIPFIAQNYGAGRMDRIRQARRGTMTFALLYGVFIGVMFLLFAEPMAGIFSSERRVIDVLCSYIYITCMGYGMLEIHRYAGFVMTGAHEPVQASVLNIIRAAVLLIPLSLLGSFLAGLEGIFWGRLATDLLAGAIGIWWSGRVISSRSAA